MRAVLRCACTRCNGVIWTDPVAWLEAHRPTPHVWSNEAVLMVDHGRRTPLMTMGQGSLEGT